MPFMFEYSDHMQKRLKQRGISQQQIEETLRYPDHTESTYRNRYLSQKDFHGRVLTVVAIKEPDKIILITVYWKKPLKEA